MAIAPEALFDIKDSRAYEMQTARVFLRSSNHEEPNCLPSFLMHLL